ncbi:hypothetical protein QJS10_CPA09g01044 [Acorus calamus]|uniref:Uncharacterized protein n=1 Tax=Acorus calamus TaxID=4465 RepID=A0AAV9E848_ACOCL|nr:hypothetical protein QJS10_CPA09g01044 [Acorus calamus]
MDVSVTGLESKAEEADATCSLLEAEEQAVPLKKGKGVATWNSAVPRERSTGVSAGELKEREEVGWQLVRGRRRNKGDPQCSRSGAPLSLGEYKQGTLCERMP